MKEIKNTEFYIRDDMLPLKLCFYLINEYTDKSYSVETYYDAYYEFENWDEMNMDWIIPDHCNPIDDLNDLDDDDERKVLKDFIFANIPTLNGNKVEKMSIEIPKDLRDLYYKKRMEYADINNKK